MWKMLYFLSCEVRVLCCALETVFLSILHGMTGQNPVIKGFCLSKSSLRGYFKRFFMFICIICKLSVLRHHRISEQCKVQKKKTLQIPLNSVRNNGKDIPLQCFLCKLLFGQGKCVVR